MGLIRAFESSHTKVMLLSTKYTFMLPSIGKMYLQCQYVIHKQRWFSNYCHSLCCLLGISLVFFHEHERSEPLIKTNVAALLPVNNSKCCACPKQDSMCIIADHNSSRTPTKCLGDYEAYHPMSSVLAMLL